MFLELFVKDLALIESALLKWQPGLNVLTGETGAGKSMVIDAVALLLGGRSSQDYIRKGAESCMIQGTFTSPYSAEIILKLQDLALIDPGNTDFDEDLFLGRELNKNGKSVCRINLRQVPLTAFKELSRLLINIHGQMEHMSLLEPENQKVLLDSFGDEKQNQALVLVAKAYEQWQKKLAQLKQTIHEETDMTERQQLLSFQIKELTEADLKIEEENELLAELEILQNSQHLLDNATGAYLALNNGQNPPLTTIAKAIEKLENLVEIDPSLTEDLQRLNDVYFNLEDLIIELRNYKSSIPDDPNRLDGIQERLQQIKVLSKKYGGDITYMLQLIQDYQAELEHWQNHDALIAKLNQEVRDLEQYYQKEATRLRQLRQKTGQKLAAAITQELHYLQMPAAVFGVDLLDCTPSAKGFDEVVFMINPNPGEGFKPVAKIASGGEMARIMLSIKVILAKLDVVPTLIFDEIDTGLGGVALVSVAEKLLQISRNTQAICVTHAPVIAAYADHNLLVSKTQKQERTLTKVEVLSASDKLQEITRMLAGQNATDTTTKQAQELIAAGKNISI